MICKEGKVHLKQNLFRPVGFWFVFPRSKFANFGHSHASSHQDEQEGVSSIFVIAIVHLSLSSYP